MNRRRAWVPLALTLALSVFAQLPAAPAHAFTTRSNLRLNNYEARLLDLVNQARHSAGVPTLTPVAALTDIARRWSVHQAAVGDISHNPNLRSQATSLGCGRMQTTGENVAFDAEGADDMFTMYMNSPHHRANILDARFRVVGFGDVERVKDGWNYDFNTMDFASSCTSYGTTREPAHGMRGDAVSYTKRTDFLHAENGNDLRTIGAITGAGLHIGSFRADSPSAADDAIRMSVNTISSVVTGSAEFVVRDAMNLSNVWGITLTLAQTNPTGSELPVTLIVKEAWGYQANLGTVYVATGGPHAYTLTLPAAARRYVNHLVLSIPAGGVVNLAAGLLSGQSTTLAVHRITFEV